MTDNDTKEYKIHPQVRMLMAQLCEAFNIPMQESKLIIWQQKLGIPNTQLLKEAYEQITDGKGVTLKKPTIAEFMQIYKEKESNFFKRQSANLEHQYGKQNYTRVSKEMVPKLVSAIMQGEQKTNHLIKVPHEGVQDGRRFRLTRDAHGRDFCYFYDYAKNLD